MPSLKHGRRTGILVQFPNLKRKPPSRNDLRKKFLCYFCAKNYKGAMWIGHIHTLTRVSCSKCNVLIVCSRRIDCRDTHQTKKAVVQYETKGQPIIFDGLNFSERLSVVDHGHDAQSRNRNWGSLERGQLDASDFEVPVTPSTSRVGVWQSTGRNNRKHEDDDHL